MNTSKKILITGTTGLVGSRLLPRLAATGWDCRALVRDGKKIPDSPQITVAEGDLFDATALTKAVKDISAVIHLAAVFRSSDTDLIWKTNLAGTQNLINAVKAHAPVARFILASTSNVYNADNPHPGKEDDAVNPQRAYPASKIAAEKCLHESGLNRSVLRFPFVYGDKDGHLEMLPKQAKTAKWHPAMKLSTIHHRDIATAMEMALAGCFDSRTVNISDESPLSIYELVQLIGEKLDGSSEPLTNPWYLHMDASLARHLGFQPEIRSVYQAVQMGLM